MKTDPLIVIEQVTKDYTRGSEVVSVLRGVDLQIARGDFVALMGRSGSGKTTLLNLIAGLDQPTSGRILFGGREISALDETQLARWRTNAVGFVFQFFHLIPVLTAFENVELPLLLMNMTAARRREQTLRVLELVGLEHRLRHRPGQLSGGEQQRVGIARALVTDPDLIVADEPTGDLDSERSEEILDLLESLNANLKKTILIVTHDPVAGGRARRLLRIDKGVLAQDNTKPHAPPAAVQTNGTGAHPAEGTAFRPRP
jgi:putative ABC transport system ATP-binding protein